MNVDLMVAKGLEHVSGDGLAFSEIQAGDADQGYIGVVNDRLTADVFMDPFCNLQRVIQVILVDAHKDMVVLISVKQVHNQFNVDAGIGNLGKVATANARVSGDTDQPNHGYVIFIY